MKYGKINKTDIANGSGVRVSIFVSGCDRHCKGCFNPETWDYNYGKDFSKETIDEIIEAMKPDYISGLTVLGGEPLAVRNYSWVCWLCMKVKSAYPNKTIWLYTGDTFEEISDLSICDYVDVVVDGAFVESQKDLSLEYRGSRNQRIIDVKKWRFEKWVE
jgi:anaerobic ribonucleoside-triphosphate reductase activating protein